MSKIFSVRLDDEIKASLDEIARRTRFKKSLLVNAALAYFVHLEDEARFELIKRYASQDRGTAQAELPLE